MNRSSGDPKLGEVKAVLHRLQTFSEPDSAVLQSERTEANTSGTSRRTLAAIVLTITWAFVVLAVFWLTISPSGWWASSPSATTADATPKASATTGSVPVSPPAAATAVAMPRGPSSADAPVSPPALRPSVPLAAVEAAQNLLAKGQVQAARQHLLGLAAQDAVDVAWILARSYDPNVLAAIPAADAGPDIEQATRWYRAWHAAALKQGLVPKSLSVERIISAMR